jgi:co-chaperonin GroES (HSP10)
VKIDGEDRLIIREDDVLGILQTAPQHEVST